MSDVRITALIINRNRTEETQRAVESIKNQTYKNIEIIIHDNSGLNMGVALPSNIAEKKSKAKYLFFLDNDAYLTDPNYIERFVWIMEEFDGCAFVFGRVLNPDGTDQWIDIFGLAGYDSLQKCKSFNGNGVLIRRDAFLEVGGYERTFFAYYLEPELAARFYDAGYYGMYSPHTLIHEQTDKARESDTVAYLMVRNGYLFFVSQREMGKIIRRFGWALLHCSPKTFVKAHIDTLRLLPKWI
jgi:GT2 family glycosyltransferase